MMPEPARSALLDALGEKIPFGLGHDPRHEIEGDQPLGRLGFAIDVEGDARAPEEILGLVGLGGQFLDVLLPEPLVEAGIGFPDIVVIEKHFVERRHLHPPDLSSE